MQNAASHRMTPLDMPFAGRIERHDYRSRRLDPTGLGRAFHSNCCVGHLVVQTAQRANRAGQVGS
jgi:hypothetical protein